MLASSHFPMIQIMPPEGFSMPLDSIRADTARQLQWEKSKMKNMNVFPKIIPSMADDKNISENTENRSDSINYINQNESKDQHLRFVCVLYLCVFL